MTNLTTTHVAQLTAIITGGGFKRSANKDAAIKRFKTVLNERVGDAMAETYATDILKAPDFATAQDWLATALEKGSRGIETSEGEQGRWRQTDDGPVWEPIRKIGGAGLARLRANADADAIREQTVAEGKAARAAVSRPTEVEAKDRTTGKDALGPKPKVEKVAKAAKAAKATTRSRLDTTAKIAKVVDNPKKEGSRSHARFALYKAGQTVEQFIAACVAAGYPESEAKADLSWDRRKGFIEIKEATAPASNRPGDMAAVYAEENGVSYAEALVACNMD